MALKIVGSSPITHPIMITPSEWMVLFLYQENHALDAWFKKAYGDEEKTCYNNWAVCQLQQLK